MEKMTIEKAREIISQGKFLRPIYSKFSFAEGFIEGWESLQAEVEELRNSLRKTKSLLRDYKEALLREKSL